MKERLAGNPQRTVIETVIYLGIAIPLAVGAVGWPLVVLATLIYGALRSHWAVKLPASFVVGLSYFYTSENVAGSPFVPNQDEIPFAIFFFAIPCGVVALLRFAVDRYRAKPAL